MHIVTYVHTVFEKVFIFHIIMDSPLIILQETAMVGTSCKIFLQTQNRLEMALLTFLRNTNLHNVKIALTCFRFLVQLTEVLMTTGEPCPVPFADNIKPYQALSDASSNLLIGQWGYYNPRIHCVNELKSSFTVCFLTHFSVCLQLCVGPFLMGEVNDSLYYSHISNTYFESCISLYKTLK